MSPSQVNDGKCGKVEVSVDRRPSEAPVGGSRRREPSEANGLAAEAGRMRYDGIGRMN